MGTKLALHYSCSVMNYFSWGCLSSSVVCKVPSGEMRHKLEPPHPCREVGSVLTWELLPLLESFRSHACPGMSWGCPWSGMFFRKDVKPVAATIGEGLSCWLRLAKEDVSLPMSNGLSQGFRSPQPWLQSEAGVSRGVVLSATWKT